ncbi:MAG: PAS domain S-box protein, partial [Acidobacteriota bacterium]
EENFSRLWLDSGHEALLLEATTSFFYLDSSTQPPRHLEVRLTPLTDGGGDRLISTEIEIRPAVEQTAGAAASSDELDHVVENVPALVWTCGLDGGRDSFNAAWTQFTGRDRVGDRGRGWLEAVHPDDVEPYSEAFNNAFHAVEDFRFDYRLRRVDGVYRSMRDLARPRRRSDGEVLGYVGSTVDITDLRKTEARLRHSENWHRDLIESTDNLVLQLDAEGLIAFVNPICRKIFGAEPEECIGFPMESFLDPQDRARFNGLLEGWLGGEVQDAHFEFRVENRNGESRDLLLTINATLDRDGAATVTCVGQDITERKRGERVRRIQSQVLESMIEGVSLTNPAGFVLYTNPALDAMFGYDRGELIGQHLSALGGETRALAGALEERGFFVGDLTQKKKDGQHFPTIARVKAIEIDGSQHWIAVIEDITQRKRDESDRRRLDRRIQQVQKLESLGVLAGGIAHDFNNLLMVILGNASLALQDLDPDQTAFGDIEQIESAAMRAADLTKQMLAYSGKGQFLVEPTDLSSLVEEMAHLLANSVAKGIDIDYQLSKIVPVVECDVSQLRQVVVNLTTNASEANATRIVVRTGSRFCDRSHLDRTFLADDLPEGVYAFLEVEDSGQGMNADTLAKIFDPFFTTKFTGRGLGLAAVLGIVRGHRGGIKITSSEGQGTTFTVLLPIANQPDPTDPELIADRTALTGEGTVLVVDDDDSVRDMAERMLVRLGFDVLSADGGGRALEIFRRRRDDICVVLLDMTMPHMDGEETFRSLQAIRPGVPVVLSSGYSEQIAAERFDGKGLAGFLQKPYRQTDLILKLDEILDLR